MRTSTKFAILLAGLLRVVWVFGQQPLELRVDVSLVTLDVEVTDSAGRPVSTLKKEDFQVYEGGMLQTIRSFDSVETPYNILLVFDCSASTQPDWPFLVAAMNRFGQMLRPQDRIEIAQFGGKFKVLRKWFGRADTGANVNVQPNDPVCSGTDFYGAVDQALNELKSVRGRKGTVMLTDGGHNSIPSRPGSGGASGRNRYVDAVEDREFQKRLKSVASSDVAFYFVAVNTDLNPDDFNPDDIYNKQQLRSRIEALASTSGGRVAFPRKPEEVVKLYEQLAHDLGMSYSLGYTPDNLKSDGTYRKIEVRVLNPSLRVKQSRDGYTADSR